VRRREAFRQTATDMLGLDYFPDVCRGARDGCVEVLFRADIGNLWFQ
jgi:hypothetical protein